MNYGNAARHFGQNFASGNAVVAQTGQIFGRSIADAPQY
jgi:hypothetical protein